MLIKPVDASVHRAVNGRAKRRCVRLRCNEWLAAHSDARRYAPPVLELRVPALMVQSTIRLRAPSHGHTRRGAVDAPENRYRSE